MENKNSDDGFIVYKNNEARETVKRLGEDMASQSKKCSENCRYVMASVLGVLWAFLLGETNKDFRLVLSIIIFVCILFMLINTWRYYFVTKKINGLYRYSQMINDKTMEWKMTELSDTTFFIQGLEVAVCSLVVLLLIAFIIVKYVVV